MKWKLLFIKTVILLTSLSLIAPLNAQGPPKHEAKKYTLAVVPQFPPIEIHERWGPFVDKLSREIGVNFQLKAYKTFQEFEADILSGIPDFAFMNPYQIVIAKNAQGYIPLVRDKRQIKGIIVVHKDSPIQSVEELNNKEIAFVSPKTICSILLSHELSTGNGKTNFIARYVGTANNVYRNVILGKTPAGGTLDTPLSREPAEIGAQLRIIYETSSIAPHSLAVHPRVPENIYQAVINAVLKLSQDKTNHGMLDRIQMLEPVKASYQNDYMPIEKLYHDKNIINGG